MKGFLGRKKGLRVLSLLLVCCLLVTTVGPHYVKAQGLQASDFLATGVELSSETNGVKVTYPNAAEWWQRTVTSNAYNTEQGIHVEIAEIDITDDADYSFAIAIGNGNPATGDYNHWSDKAGYMLVYGKSGHFEIFPTAGYNTAPMANAGTKLVSVERESLDGSITMDLKLEDDSYVITVNDATYTIPAVYTDSSKAIVDTKNLYLAFGILGGTDTATGDAKWETSLGAGTSFVIAEMSNNYQELTVDELEWDETKLFAAEQMTYNADSNYAVLDVEGKGVQVTHSENTAFYARVNTLATYNAEKGIQLELTDIASPSDSDYALALSLGNTADQWYDKTGYMIVYGSAGDFSIVATGSGGLLTTGDTLISLVREPLTSELSVNIRLSGDNYVITVNGDVYTIPAVHKTYPLGDTANLYMGVGMLDGGSIGSIDLLKTFTDSTFTIKYVTDELSVAKKEAYGYEMTKNVSIEELSEGLKVTYASDSASGEDYVQRIEALDVSQGVHLEVNEMSAEAENYSLAVAFGNEEEQWADAAGYMLVYERDGQFKIYETPYSEGTELVSIKREALNGTLVVDMKLTGENYIITVNGDTYTIPAPAQETDINQRFSIGMLEGGAASFVIAELSDAYDAPVIEKVESEEDDILFAEQISYKTDCNYEVVEQDGNGVKVSHSADTPFYARVNTTGTYNAENGIHIEVADIESPADEDYAIALAIGNQSDQWYDKTGYMLVYGSDGSFSIVATSGNEGTHLQHGETMVSLVREPLAGTLSVDITLVENDFVIIVNDAVYVIPATHYLYPLEDVNNLLFGIGMLDGGAVKDIDLLKTFADATFTITQITDAGVTKIEEECGYGKTEGLALEESADGVKVIYTSDDSLHSERVQTLDTFDAEQGIHLEVNDITADDYSFAIVFGNAKKQWSDKAGYMLVYRADGYFELTATPADEETKVISLNREKLDGSLVLDMKLIDGNYILTVNGDTYTVPAIYPEESKALEDTKNLRLAFGILEGAKADASYVIAELSDAYNAPEIDEVDSTDATFLTKEEVTYKEECSYKATEMKNAGVKFTHTTNTVFYARATTITTRSAKDGIHMVVKDIASPSDEDYSIAVSFGNSSDQWYDKTGYMLVYGKEGQFSIVATSGNAGTHIQHGEVLISVMREPLEGTLKVDVKLQNQDYVITVNGAAYVIPAAHYQYPIGNTEDLYVSVGMLDGGKVSELELLKQLADATFTIEKIYSKVTSSAEDNENSDNDDNNDIQEEVVDNRNTIPPEGMGVEGTSFRFEETKAGLVITHIAGGAAWERVYYQNAYLVEDEGVKLEIENIVSESDNYSLVIGIGGSGPIWYDRQGCMILYSKSGNLSIIAPSGVAPEGSTVEDPNDAKVLASKKLSQYKNSLSLTIKMQDDDYIFIINGEEFIIGGEYLGNSEQIFLSLGVMSDYNLKNGDISGLKYYESDFKDSDVSFTVANLIAQGVGAEVIEGNAVSPEEVGMTVTTDNIILQKVENGLKVIHTAQAGAWERAAYNNAFSPLGSGIHIGIEEITSKAKNYSLTVKIGSTGSWYDTRGYMIIYGKSGNFSIVATDGTITNPNTSPVLVSEVREALGETFDLDVKLKGTNYQITVNGKTYIVPAQHSDYPIENPKELYLAFGVMSDGKLGEIDYYGNTFKRYAVSFVLADVTGALSYEDPGEPYGMFTSGYNWKLAKVENGVKVTQGVDGTGWERVSMNEPYKTTEGGLCIELKDIVSEDPNYSIAVAIGNDKGPWYDTTGYMIIYGKSGNFAIIATDASVINPNQSPVVVSEVREALGKTLSINIRLMDDGENYAVTVNGKVYIIPAEHEDFELEYTDIVYVSFGILSDGEIGSLVYDKEYKKGETSFTIASVYHSEEDVVDEIEVEEPKEDEPKEVEKEEPKADALDEEPKDLTGIIIAGVSVALLLALVVVIAVLRMRKKRVGGEE